MFTARLLQSTPLRQERNVSRIVNDVALRWSANVIMVFGYKHSAPLEHLCKATSLKFLVTPDAVRIPALVQVPILDASDFAGACCHGESGP